MATQAEVGAHLFLSQPEVSKYLASGVFPKATQRGGLDLAACREAYILHLRERAAGRSSAAADDENLDLVEQRARLAKEQADAQAMKNAVMRGDLIPRADVVVGMQAAFANARARLLSIPVKAAPLIIGLTVLAEVVEKLTELVHEACRELAAARAIPAPPDGAADGGSGDGGASDMGSAAETDGQRMGGSVPRSVSRGRGRAG